MGAYAVSGQRLHTDKNSFTYLFLCLKDGSSFPCHKHVVQVEMVVLVPTF